MKLATYILHVSGNFWKRFQGHTWKIKVTQRRSWKSCELDS